MDNYPEVILSNFKNDYRAAYKHLAKQYLTLNKQFSELWNSQFFDISHLENGQACFSPKADRSNTRRKWFYVDKNTHVQELGWSKVKLLKLNENPNP